MFNLKLTLSVVLIISFHALTSSSAEIINKQLTRDDSKTKAQQFNETLAETVKNLTEPNDRTNLSNTRTARNLLTHSRTPTFTLRRRQPIKIRSRADHFPLRPQLRRVHNGLPNAPPQLQSQNVRFGYESLKSSKYMPSSKGANAVFLNNGKTGLYRPQLLGAHPNSIHVPALSQQYIHNFKASPAFNGQVVVHPVTHTQQKQPVSTQDNNSYPKYIKPQQQPANTIAGLSTQMQQKQQQQKPSIIKYPEFKQYPIPDQEKMQKFNEQHDKYLQQQKYFPSNNPLAYYEMQQAQLQQHHHQQQHKAPLHQELQTQAQQQYQHQHQQNYAGQQHQYLSQQQQQQQQQLSIPIPIHNTASGNNKQSIAFPSEPTVPSKMYSVYEENDMTELQNNNYQTVSYQGLDKEAQEYLRFMNTNDYFLPKKDPNYRVIDEETDRRQYNNLKSGYAPQSYHTQGQAVSAYEQPLQSSQYTNSLYSADTTAGTSANGYNQGQAVSQLFYKQDPSTSPSSSTVVRTSYQAGYGQNKLGVDAQDKNQNQYSLPLVASSPSTYVSTPVPVYSYARQNSAGDRTPEPLRFEFTERDAMVGGVAYTHAPQGQLRSNSLAHNSVTPIVANVESSTPNSIDFAAHYSSTQNYLRGQENVKPVVEEDEDDPEDGDDMQEAGNNLYGRQPVVSSDSNTNKQSSSTTEAPPSEQKDTEEYCERICAIVEDENEEIVCGSDGYMYTSEAQLECYASCLHIDVTIQGKGSCSAR